MQISIKVLSTGVSFGCEVKETDTIYIIKSIIKEIKEDITPNNQLIIFFNGIILEDHMTIASYSIENNSTIYMGFLKEIKGLHVGNETKNVNSHQGSNKVHVSVPDLVGKKDGRTLNSIVINEIFQLWMLARPSLKIFIKMPQVGNTLCLYIYNSLTVHDIKKKIWDKMGIAKVRQTLIYSGRTLDDDQTLAGYSLQHNSIFHAFFGFKDRNQELKLFIHDTRKEVTFELMVQKCYTVLSIKTIIESMMEIPICLQNLYHVEDKFQDWKTLTHYQIENNSTLFLFVHSHPVQIFIKTPEVGENENNVIMLEVKNTDTIDEIIAKIPQEDMRGIPNPLCLFLGETRLMNNLTLSHYDIGSGTFFQLERSIQVNVGIPSGEVITVDLKPTDTVDIVKEKIEDFCGIPWQLQTLTYLGDEVDEFYTLEDYELHLGSLWNLRWKFGDRIWSFFWPTYGV